MNLSKKLIGILISVLPFSASADNIRDYEVELALSTKCYPTPLLKEHFNGAEVVLASEDTTKDKHVLIDYLLYVPSKKGMFLVRENNEVNYSCVITFFEKKDNLPKKKRTSMETE